MSNTEIMEIVKKRNIKEILHFTTNLGLTGVLYSGALKSRYRLKEDQAIEHILRLNTKKVLDVEWIDYVNLSISKINNDLFNISSRHWHRDVWWCILSFRPEIMTHDGVFFTTTNNAYHAHVHRGSKPKDLEAMFASEVKGRYGIVITRDKTIPDCFTTCSQAEVLYPGELSTKYLRNIYVRTNEDIDDVEAQIAVIGHSPIEVKYNLEKFEES